MSKVTIRRQFSIDYDLDITNSLFVSPQVRYIEVFDITNPRFNEQYWPVPSDFVKSRFHCNWSSGSCGSLIRGKFNLKINRSVKTPLQEHSRVVGSGSWVPVKEYNQAKLKLG